MQIGQELEVSYTRAAVNLEMAETCLAYLLDFIEKHVVLRKENVMSYPLARFSAELWDDFYREAVASSGGSNLDMTKVNALVMRLFASHETMLKWIQLCDPDNDTHEVQLDLSIADVRLVIYYAALLGLPDIVRRLIEEGHSINETVGGHCGTPLIATCVYGRENITSILLDNGADPNLPGDHFRGCPLAAAIEQNHKDIVKLLLKAKDVDVNACRFPLGSRGWVPITRSAESLTYIAAKSGSLEMVNALLEAGADPNIRGGMHYTALQIACYKGSADIVATLLKYGANAKICGGASSSPLQAACASHSLQIVKILIGESVDVNYVGKKLSVSYVHDTSNVPIRR